MRYFLIYKPFGVQSQFRPDAGQIGLGTLHDFPVDVYPVGRLDADSEGLLLLTNDTYVNKKLLDPVNRHWRTYYVQVEGTITQEAIEQLIKGVSISINGKKYFTAKARARTIQQPDLPPRVPPIRFRKSVPDSWLELSLTEGKNRQVRKMTAATGFPTLRLVRVKIEDLSMDQPGPGKVMELEKSEIYHKLKL
jgi:23S rRNA pseudouridine2457 synthase